MAVFKNTDKKKLHLYMNGNLIYKRWFDTWHAKVFDVMAYDKHTLVSIRNSAHADIIEETEIDKDKKHS